MRLKDIAIVLSISLFGSSASALDSTMGQLSVTAVVSGLDQPWGFDFLPDGGLLITEREGAIIHVDADGKRNDVTGVPRVAARGQGGLLDILVPSDFAQTREIFLSYSARLRGGTGTALGKAKLNSDGSALEEFTQIFAMDPSRSGRHFGSRVIEAGDGTLFLTIGDRGDRPSAQDLSVHNGSIVRVTRDGKVPADNPFVGQDGVRPEIWSFGHRNPQGAALDLSGNLWTAEHGAKGGDEVNRVRKGANYGWPVISYGVHYSGQPIGEGSSRPGMEQPEHYWDPSIAPSGLMIYSGKLWPEWRGDLFVGSLKFDYISRLDGGAVSEVEQLKSRETGRVREIMEGPDGNIWFLSVEQGALYRISP